MTTFGNGRPEDGTSDGDVPGGDGRTASKRMCLLEPTLVPSPPTANVPPPPCGLCRAPWNFLWGPRQPPPRGGPWAPARSSELSHARLWSCRWLRAGIRTRAPPPISAAVPHGAARREQPASSERTGARLEPARPAPFPLPRESTRTAAARHLPPCPRPRTLVLLTGHRCAARPFHVARCLSPPLAVDTRAYLPLPSHLPCLSSAAQGIGPRRSPVPPAPPSPLRAALVHCICCRVRAAPPLRNACGCRSRCARLLLARFACARASV